ncbi:MAG: hypothetical protein KF710_01385 [Rhodocyclaceae bacterium]|nr:hypothetical protein [Rhodocyclaceae bacterium]
MMTRKAKTTLTLLLLVCTLPVAASYISYFLWKPESTVNYGELLSIAPVPSSRLSPVAGSEVDGRGLKGRWTMVYVSGGKCDGNCESSLYFMRQVRTAQGEQMGRVARLWLLDDDVVPSPAFVAKHEGLEVARADASWSHAFAAAKGHISLVDPLGNLMMRFPANPEPKLMIKDLARLLKYSRL